MSHPLREAARTAMDGVHGRSRVTSGASRLHHVAGVTQIAPGALPTSGKADGPNSPVKGCWLARPPVPVRDKSRHREHPRRNDGTRRLWDMGGASP